MYKDGRSELWPRQKEGYTFKIRIEKVTPLWTSKTIGPLLNGYDFYFYYKLIAILRRQYHIILTAS